MNTQAFRVGVSSGALLAVLVVALFVTVNLRGFDSSEEDRVTRICYPINTDNAPDVHFAPERWMWDMVREQSSWEVDIAGRLMGHDLDRGVRVAVLETHGELAQIRILEGERSGSVGWTDTAWLKPQC